MTAPFTVHAPSAAPIPLVLDSPHSGEWYPDDFDHLPARAIVRQAEDTHVARLWSHAPAVGATLVEAHFPRAYIDANRSLADIDTELLPVDTPLRDTAVAFTIDPLGWVLTGGEDHALAATFPPDAQLPDGFVRIGTVSFGEPGVTVDGKARKGPKGWVHFGG